MKKINVIISTLTLTIVLVVVSGARNTSKANQLVPTSSVFYPAKQIDKIEVNGNVEVLLTQDVAERVKIYDEQLSKNALVQWEEGVLRISSYEKKPVTVLISVTDLKSIDASGLCVVKSIGKISCLELKIKLQDQATAFLHAQTLNVSAHLKDAAMLKLAGEAEGQFLRLTGTAKLDASDFTAQSRFIQVSDYATAFLGNTEVKSATSPNSIRVAKGF